ncbi:MAG: hypothetical protein NTY53_20070, partial [Kiritimatiellaeota bacterium]|nr:hypothetical protein [Kiritimatiellota bacterium]
MKHYPYGAWIRKHGPVTGAPVANRTGSKDWKLNRLIFPSPGKSHGYFSKAWKIFRTFPQALKNAAGALGGKGMKSGSNVTAPRWPVWIGRMVCALILFALVPAAGMQVVDFVLAGQGVTPPPIVIPKDAAPYTHEAAQTLADYVAKISGAKLAVVEGEPSPLPEHAVWVGYQPVLKKLFP